MGDMLDARRRRAQQQKAQEADRDTRRRQVCIQHMNDLARAVVGKIENHRRLDRGSRDTPGFELEVVYNGREYAAWHVMSGSAYGCNLPQGISRYETMLLETAELVTRFTYTSGREEILPYDPDRYGDSMSQVMNTYGRLVNIIDVYDFRRQWLEIIERLDRE